MVRDDLSNMNIQLLDNKYFITKDVDLTDYRFAIQQMGNAPEFEYIGNRNSIISPIRELNKNLKEFYNKANIEELYEKYKPYYEKELEKYKDSAVIEALAYTIEYLRLDTNDIPEFYVQVNLLDSFERGYGMNRSDVILGKGVIIGPSDDVNTLNVVHEFLHGIINPILEGTEGYMDNSETIVRVLSASIVYDDYELQSYVNMQVNKGYKRTKYFFNKFKDEYPNYNGTLEEFIKEII